MKETHTKGRLSGTLLTTAFITILLVMFAAYGPGSRAQAAAANRIGHVAPAHETETGQPEETETHHPESTRTHEGEPTETHQAEGTRTPEATRTHEVEPSETVEPEETETHEPEVTRTHVEGTHTPEATRTHEVEPSETAEPEETHHPEGTPEATHTHEVEPSETAEPEETHHPEGTHTPEATETTPPFPSPIPTGQAPANSGNPGGTTNSPVSIPGTGVRTFPQTGVAVKGIFLSYWDSNGGIAQQGLPLSGVMQEKSELNGKTYAVQYFERAVFEYHPEVTTSNSVMLSQLGRFRYNAMYPAGASGQVVNRTNTRYFPETKHSVGGLFLQYWQQNGGLAQQGFPLSDEFQEKSPLDGKTYTVQYFERAVFEYHPENKAPYNVLLSQLGTFRLKGK